MRLHIVYVYEGAYTVLEVCEKRTYDIMISGFIDFEWKELWLPALITILAVRSNV